MEFDSTRHDLSVYEKIDHLDHGRNGRNSRDGREDTYSLSDLDSFKASITAWAVATAIFILIL